MATRVRNTPFPMDHGIEKILRVDEERRVDTGTAGDLSPAFSPVKPRLEQLYAMPNLDDYIASQLAPSMTEAGLLMPSRFHRALREGAEELKLAEEADPRNARILRAARRLMGDQASLRDLVTMYRSALLRG